MNYTRDIDKDYFLLLKWYRYEPNPYLFSKEQIDLAEKLAQHYNLFPGNALRLIGYAERALIWALKSEQKFSVDDWSEFLQFQENPPPIRKVTFQGDGKSFVIRNPYWIDELYKRISELITTANIQGIDETAASPIESLLKSNHITRKTRPSTRIIKKIGTEIYRELVDVEKLTKWKAECILVQILSIYKIGLRVGEPLMTEQEHSNDNSPHRKKESYLTYCRGQGKNYHY